MYSTMKIAILVVYGKQEHTFPPYFRHFTHPIHLKRWRVHETIQEQGIVNQSILCRFNLYL